MSVKSFIFPPRRLRHRGFTAIWIGLGMVVFLGLCSLAVDYGRVQTAKSELRSAADAAARAAAAGIATSVTQAQNNAINIAANTTCDGTAVALTTNDIDFGTWDTTNKTFTVLSGVNRSNANAIRINAKRTSANNNPINLYFAPAVGKSTCDVTATSIALVTGKLPGITGVSSIQCHSDMFIASYNSLVTTSPDNTSNYNTNATIACNGTLGSGATAPNNIWSNVILGPTGSLNNNVTCHGTKTTQSTALNQPAGPTMVVVTNPGGVSATPNLSGNTTYTWPGGTYYFSGFTIGGNNVTINFTGPAVIYMNCDFGNNKLSTVITAYQNLPKNLIFNHAAGKTLQVQNSADFTMEYYGPNATFNAHDDLRFRGSLQCDTLILHDHCYIWYDEQLGNASALATYSWVQ